MNNNKTWGVAAASRRGASHVHNEYPCQDSFGSWNSSLAGSPCTILAVSDGHGSEEYYHSHFGSFLAIRTAYEEFVEFFQWYTLLKTGPASLTGVQAAGLERDFKASFGRRIVRRWRENVKVFRKDILRSDPSFEECPDGDFTPFGCTLLAAMITNDRAFFFQIGDGGIFVRRNNGETFRLAEEDDEPGEVTDSLASGDPEKAAITTVLNIQDVNALMLATDGLTKAFSVEDDKKIPTGIHRTIGWLLNRITVEKLDAEGPVFDQFLDSCSRSGTGDDVTVSIAFCREALIKEKEIYSAAIETGIDERAEKGECTDTKENIGEPTIPIKNDAPILSAQNPTNERTVIKNTEPNLGTSTTEADKPLAEEQPNKKNGDVF